jgi:hypothetical protein
MGHPVKLSDDLSGDSVPAFHRQPSRILGAPGSRGGVVDAGREVLALKGSGGAQSLSAALASVDGARQL